MKLRHYTDLEHGWNGLGCAMTILALFLALKHQTDYYRESKLKRAVNACAIPMLVPLVHAPYHIQNESRLWVTQHSKAAWEAAYLDEQASVPWIAA